MRWGCVVSYRYIGSDTGFDFVKLVVAVTLRERERERERPRAHNRKRVWEWDAICLGSLGRCSCNEMSNPKPSPSPSRFVFRRIGCRESRMYTLFISCFFYAQYNTNSFCLLTTFTRSLILSDIREIRRFWDSQKKNKQIEENYLTRPLPRHKTKRKHWRCCLLSRSCCYCFVCMNVLVCACIKTRYVSFSLTFCICYFSFRPRCRCTRPPALPSQSKLNPNYAENKFLNRRRRRLCWRRCRCRCHCLSLGRRRCRWLPHIQAT